MSEHRNLTGSFRKLWPHDSAKFRDHLLRLDKASRRLRFAHGVSDSFIEDYAARMGELGSIVYAYIEDGEVRGRGRTQEARRPLGPRGGGRLLRRDRLPGPRPRQRAHGPHHPLGAQPRRAAFFI